MYGTIIESKLQAATALDSVCTAEHYFLVWQAIFLKIHIFQFI